MLHRVLKKLDRRPLTGITFARTVRTYRKIGVSHG